MSIVPSIKYHRNAYTTSILLIIGNFERIIEEITITIMALRYIDKKIKALELLISENGLKHGCISNIGLEITDDELTKIFEEFQYSNLLKIQHIDSVGDPDELKDIPNGNDIVAYYNRIDKKQIANLLEKLRKIYPRHDDPIIREETLEKIAKQFGNLETEVYTIELLKKSGVPRSLIEKHLEQWKMIFSVLNYYALSAKKKDFQIFKKIIENLVHPLMFDGNKKEAQGAIDMINARLEFDGFIIKDGNFQSLVKIKSKNKRVGKPFFGELKVEISLGNLASYSDGTIRYAEEIINMRNQIKDLCRFFMLYPRKLLTVDNIKEEIIRANRRKSTPNATISKYVSELGTILNAYFKKEVLFNQKEEGWLMDITKS
jgi:hypothetical protein